MAFSAYKTAYVPRPDLAAMEFKTPIGMIGQFLLPRVWVAAKAGKYYYRPWQSVTTAQIGRSPNATVTENGNVSANTPFDAVEVNSRNSVDIGQIELEGGSENAEIRAVRNSNIAVQSTIETGIVTAIDFSTSANIVGAVYDGIMNARASLLPKIRGHNGRLALYASSVALQTLRDETTIKSRFLNIGIDPRGTFGDADARLIGLAGIASTLGINVVREGMASYWPAHSIALAFEPLTAEDGTLEGDAMSTALAGVTLVYRFNAATNSMLTCFEGFNPANASPFIDAFAYIDSQVLNSDFIVPLQIAAGSATGTNTSSVTATAT